MRVESPRLAVLSMHTDPLALLGGDFTGGMNVYVREIAKALAGLGACADIFTRLESDAGARVVPVADGARLIRVEAGPRRRLDKDAQLAWVDAFARGVANFAREDGVAYDGVSAHYWLSGLAGEMLAGTWGVPLSVRFHTLAALKNDALPGDARRETDARLRAEPELARTADAMLASSPAEARAIGATPGAAEVHVVPCGVDLDTFRPRSREEARARLGLKPGLAYVLSVGRIERVKGLDRLIEAFAFMRGEHPGLDARLWHVGGAVKEDAEKRGGGHRAADFASPAQAAEVARLEERARALGVAECLIFAGAKPQEELPLYYSAADLFALPSRYESFGMTALEAAACGLKVLAFDVGGLSQAVFGGESGHLIEAGDTRAYARKMRRILENPGERPDPGALRWAESFAWERVAGAELEIWARLRPGAALSSPGAS